LLITFYEKLLEFFIKCYYSNLFPARFAHPPPQGFGPGD
jgi:hypothetical protein